MDYDLSSIQEARDLARKAKQAQLLLYDYAEQEIDKILVAMVKAVEQNAEWLARMAVDETKYGVFEHKVIKNLFAAKDIYDYIKTIKTVGVINEDKERKVIEIAVPAGVILGIVPTTNPTSTVIHNALCAIKGANAIVFAPHPNAVRCSNAAVQLLHDAAVRAGAPDGIIGSTAKISMQATQELMHHEDISVIIATGGSAMVKAAYSAGKPAFGVGPGNVPAYIERTADIKQAVSDIITSKTFDNGMICASEQAILADEPIKDEVINELKKQGAYFLNQEETNKIQNVIMTPSGAMNAAMVGKRTEFLAAHAGISIPKETRLLIAPMDGNGTEHPLAHEKLCPVLGFYTVKDWKDACKLSIELLNLGGIGHTFCIHSQDDQVIREFIRKPVFRIVVNTPSALGGIGYTTGLAPSLTLGCGTWGGSSISENLGPQHLINIKRLAYGIRKYEAAVSKECSDACAFTSEDIAVVVKKVLNQLQVQ